LPASVDYDIWRVLFSRRFTVTLREIEEHWSFSDLVNAHRMIDAYEKAESEVEAKAKKARSKRGFA